MDKAKLDKELAKVKELGIEEYVKTRAVKTNLLGLLVAVAVGFVLGALLF